MLLDSKALRRLHRTHHHAGPRLAELLSRNLRDLARGSQRVVVASGTFAAGRVSRRADTAQPDLRLTVTSWTGRSFAASSPRLRTATFANTDFTWSRRACPRQPAQLGLGWGRRAAGSPVVVLAIVLP